ncbi:MAG: thiamine diphosphokinase [Paracoccaceae bacterium]
MIVNSLQPVTLIGGGPVDADILTKAVALAPMVIAADGGLNRAHALGQKVTHVIGDMDSVDLGITGPEFHEISEQMTTDLDKCLYSTCAPFYLGVGFFGGRLDHQLAACHALVRSADKTVILLGAQDLCFLAPLELSLDLPRGTRFSLFPMGVVSGCSKGLKYPISGHDFAPDKMIGTSNITNAARVELSFDNKVMLVVLPIEMLDRVLKALR